jgi:hypothetical protein
VWSAIEKGKPSQLIIAGSLVDLACTTRMLEAFIVL